MVLVLHTRRAMKVSDSSHQQHEIKLAIQRQRRRPAWEWMKRTWRRGGLADGVVSILMTGRDLLDYQLSPQITLLLLSRYTTEAELLPVGLSCCPAPCDHLQESRLTLTSRSRLRHLPQ
ncbi:hypothetical protein E2C01_072630 [Portunus trituberculatus]|uniref:Uncharacterized protein n=1 Tax=Portunus trituberculatus TaxID=210409 RepID=A0A5B7I8C7_PORTR|nr:hypothetical protein [Portunus trituberculatus]